MNEIIKLEIINIKCPKCDRIIKGTIEHIENFPFASYYARCEKCDYDITESEWEEIDE